MTFYIICNECPPICVLYIYIYIYIYVYICIFSPSIVLLSI